MLIQLSLIGLYWKLTIMQLWTLTCLIKTWEFSVLSWVKHSMFSCLPQTCFSCSLAYAYYIITYAYRSAPPKIVCIIILFIVLQLVPEEGLHGQRKKTKASLLYGHHKLDRCPTRSNLNGSWKTLEAEEAGWWCGPIYSIWWKTLVIVDGSRCLYRSGVTAYVKVNQVYIPTPCIKILFGTLWLSNYYYIRSIFCIL